MVLGDDERLSVHPIGVTQHAQRADVELIDSSQREPTDGYLLGFGHRNNRRRPQHPAGALFRRKNPKFRLKSKKS